jgi:hypothetical protein
MDYESHWDLCFQPVLKKCLTAYEKSPCLVQRTIKLHFNLVLCRCAKRGISLRSKSIDCESLKTFGAERLDFRDLSMKEVKKCITRNFSSTINIAILWLALLTVECATVQRVNCSVVQSNKSAWGWNSEGYVLELCVLQPVAFISN